MFGTIVNAVAIVCGSLMGFAVRGRIKENYRTTVLQAVGLAVLLIGIKGALKCDDILVVIMCLVTGSLLGEWLKIEARLNALGRFLDRYGTGDGQGLAGGFVTGSLFFCVGAMAIVGALESGLTGNHQTLYAKAILDGLGSIVFASTLGIGVLFSAVSVFVYQGVITLGAVYIEPMLTPEVVAQMSSVGGLLIVAIGIKLLEIKSLNIGNMLPSIFMPLAYFAIRHLAAA